MDYFTCIIDKLFPGVQQISGELADAHAIRQKTKKGQHETIITK